MCLFKQLVGIPCPGCGMGRATLLLFQGNWSGSVYHHLLAIPFTIGMGVSVFWLVADIIYNRNSLLLFIKRPWPLWGRLTLLLLVGLSWVVSIAAGN
ncbi:MAG: DUF2752 domain-containing protein [Chitinophagia bacterium]|nr:DUF2752 domain-containing protein [Chitinophagia bacterium]